MFVVVSFVWKMRIIQATQNIVQEWMWVFVMFHSKQNNQAKSDVTMVVVTELSQIYNVIAKNLLINQNYKIK